MNIRKRIEEFEKKFIDEKMGFLAKNSRGRTKKEQESQIRTCYQRDRDRIIHCEAFRRLKDKTQVFILGDFIHPRTRLTHTLEVAQIGRTIARALNLNEDLVEAIALGHDMGHTPFGHLGEKVLNEKMESGFHHSKNSLRIADKLAKNGKGLNLTFEVRDGILKHSKNITEIDSFALPFGPPVTNEAFVVRYADGIAYLNHDIDDAVSMKMISYRDFPKDCLDVLGKSHGKRINTMVKSVIEYCIENKKIGMADEMINVTNKLRKFMFENVYLKADEYKGSRKAYDILNIIWDYYFKNFKKLKKDFNIKKEYDTEEKILMDKISALTDKEAWIVYERIK